MPPLRTIVRRLFALEQARPGGRPEPCPVNRQARRFATQITRMVYHRQGKTLLEKVPWDVPHEVQLERRRAGASRVNRSFRDQDETQLPCQWAANLVYWMAYPHGPVVIGDPRSVCASRWRQAFRWVCDDFRRMGLMKKR